MGSAYQKIFPNAVKVKKPIDDELKDLKMWHESPDVCFMKDTHGI